MQIIDSDGETWDVKVNEGKVVVQVLNGCQAFEPENVARLATALAAAVNVIGSEPVDAAAPEARGGDADNAADPAATEGGE